MMLFLDVRKLTVFPHIRPAGVNFSLGLQVQVLLEITIFHLHKSVPTAGIIRVASVIRERPLYEEIRYSLDITACLIYTFYVSFSSSFTFQTGKFTVVWNRTTVYSYLYLQIKWQMKWYLKWLNVISSNDSKEIGAKDTSHFK